MFWGNIVTVDGSLRKGIKYADIERSFTDFEIFVNLQPIFVQVI